MRYDISRLLREKELAMQIDPKQFFDSTEFKEYLETLSESLTKRWTDPPKLKLFHGAGTGSIAWTDGDTISLDLDDPLTAMFRGLYGKFKCRLGILFHELAHINFLDFEGEYTYLQDISSRGFPAVPREELGDIEEITKAMEDPCWRQVITRLYHELSNFASDAHDEKKMIESYEWADTEKRSSLVCQCILCARSCLRARSESVESAMKKTEGKVTVGLMMQLIFQYIRFGTVLVADESAMDSEPVKMLERSKRAADIAARTDSTTEKFKALDQLVLDLWPLMRQKIKDQSQEDQDQGQQCEGQQCQNQQDQGQPSPAGGSFDALLDALANAIKHSGNTQSPSRPNNSSAVAHDTKPDAVEPDPDRSKLEAEKKAEVDEKGNRDSGTDADDRAKMAMEDLLRRIKRDMAEKLVEGEIAQNTQKEIRAVNAAGPHKNVALSVERARSATLADASTYRKMYADIGSLSKRTQRSIENELRDLREGGYSRHLQFGARFDLRDVYRPDQKFFAKKKLPDDIPEMVVTVLVDCSESMAHEDRMPAAKRAAVILEDICRGLGIPVMVAGHWANGGRLASTFTVYTDFDRTNERSRYQLAQIRVGSVTQSPCNRDGMAIEIAAGLLANRPEPIKLLFIISDGQPNHIDYGKEKAANDIKEIVKKYHKRGVEVVAAAIGDDRDKIQRIYGNEFLDITDRSKLPKVLATLLKKRVMALMD